MPGLRVVLALGVLAHGAVLRACGVPQTRLRFRHGAVSELPGGVLLADSYHVSRYNTNTGLLTREMFEAIWGVPHRSMAWWCSISLTMHWP